MNYSDQRFRNDHLFVSFAFRKLQKWQAKQATVPQALYHPMPAVPAQYFTRLLRASFYLSAEMSATNDYLLSFKARIAGMVSVFRPSREIIIGF
jgi:hypothetical protein